MKIADELFEKAKLLILSIIEDYEIEYPLDIYDLAKRMGFELVPYSAFEEHRSLLMKQSEDGFNKYHEDRKIWSIYYNEKVELKERIKFTIAHEIGHILLQTELEELANFFAGYLLAPVPLIIEYKYYTEEQIMGYFKVGYKCAHSCLNRTLSRILHNEPNTEYENTIIHSQKKAYCGNNKQ